MVMLRCAGAIYFSGTRLSAALHHRVDRHQVAHEALELTSRHQDRPRPLDGPNMVPLRSIRRASCATLMAIDAWVKGRR